MARPLSLLSYLFLIAIAASIITVAVDGDRVFLLGEAIATATIGCLLMVLWLKALRQAVIESQDILNRNGGRVKLQMSNLNVLSLNHTEITRKLERSAMLIANLSNPESAASFADLNSGDAIDGAIPIIRSELQLIQ